MQFYRENQESFSGLKHYRPYRYTRSTNNLSISAFGRRIGTMLVIATLTGAIVPRVVLAQTGSSTSAISVEEAKRKAREAFAQKDYQQAVSWLRKAADQGDADAQNGMGLTYRDGLGVPQDYAQAMNWFRKAADQGYADAQNNIGKMYRDAQGVPQDDKQAMAWYRKAADQGNAFAQVNIGSMYHRGQGGVAQDDAQAVIWFRKAAEQGNAEAEYLIGAMYLAGKGLQSDPALALNWLQKAAQQGNAEANYTIGLMYENGVGVPKDTMQASNWYEKAAGLGHAEAKARLAQLQEAPTAKAGIINLVCEDTTGNGTPVEDFIFIDPVAKYVKFQAPNNTMEYKDGVNGKALTSGTYLFMGPAPPLQQFVIIGDDVITFGGRAKDGTVEIRIDRTTRLLTVNGGPPIQCSVLPSKRQF
jgi:TPR repeat protein